MKPQQKNRGEFANTKVQPCMWANAFRKNGVWWCELDNTRCISRCIAQRVKNEMKPQQKKRLAGGQKLRNPCQSNFAAHKRHIGQWVCTLNRKLCERACSRRVVERGQKI